MRKHTDFARQLRGKMTDAELSFWFAVRDRRYKGMRFRRQDTIGDYIVDFCCHEQNLIIELDGGQHAEEAARRYDQRRTETLQSHGYRVLRFWDNEVMSNLPGVLETIQQHLHPHPAFSLGEGEGKGPLSRGERGQDKSGKEKIAAFDLGTNSLRMLVGESDGHTVRPLYSRLDACRIGRDLRRTGVLSPEGTARALLTLRGWADENRRAGIRPLAGVATEAVRRARDGAAFLTAAAEAAGVALELISGEREAELTWRGVTASLPGLPDPVAIVDIGGGSTEVIVAAGAARRAVSLPLGSVVATEEHVRHDPPAAAEVAAVGAAARALLAPLAATVAAVVGVGGTATTLAALAQALPEYDPRAVHGARVSAAHLGRLNKMLGLLTTAERELFPGLGPGRADIIVAGAAILAAALAVFRRDEFIASDNGILFGLLTERAER